MVMSFFGAKLIKTSLKRANLQKKYYANCVILNFFCIPCHFFLNPHKLVYDYLYIVRFISLFLLYLIVFISIG